MLVGTASVEASELLSRMLKLQKIPHSVLNARYHLQEAEIVARAGQKGTVTISTNMAGPRHGHQTRRGRRGTGRPAVWSAPIATRAGALTGSSAAAARARAIPRLAFLCQLRG